MKVELKKRAAKAPSKRIFVTGDLCAAKPPERFWFGEAAALALSYRAARRNSLKSLPAAILERS